MDLLYACARGRASLEIADPAAAVREAVDNYSALYSEVLLEYLNGKHDEALELAVENGKSFGLLRLGALADVMKSEVPKRLKAKRGVDPKITQLPDDIISRSTANSWVSRVPLSVTRSQTPVTPVSRSRPITPFTVSMKLVAESLAGDLGKWNDLLSRSLGANAAALQRSVRAQAASFGPQHFETRCGIKVRGTRVVRTVQRNVGAEFLGTDGNIVRLRGVPKDGALVLLVVENGSGAAIPALPEFVTALTFEDGQLVDVSYEPSANSWRSDEYKARAPELRSLRTSISASAAFGVFRLDEQDALVLAKRMQYAKGVDPSLALYAAYAYDTLQRQDLIDEMRGYLESDIGLTFFDVALLSSKGLKGGRILPSFPMLSQGWALLSAYRAELPVPLKGIEMRRVPVARWRDAGSGWAERRLYGWV